MKYRQHWIRSHDIGHLFLGRLSVSGGAESQLDFTVPVGVLGPSLVEQGVFKELISLRPQSLLNYDFRIGLAEFIDGAPLFPEIKSICQSSSSDFDINGLGSYWAATRGDCRQEDTQEECDVTEESGQGLEQEGRC